MLITIRITLIVLFSLLVAACGGGSGYDDDCEYGEYGYPYYDDDDDEYDDEYEYSEYQECLNSAGFISRLQFVFVEDISKTLVQARQAARNRPNFGSRSITQSSNSSAIASTTFDGSNVSVNVTGQGSTFSLSSASDSDIGITFSTLAPAVQGHQIKDNALVKFTANSRTGAYVRVSWNSSDPSDYLAGGYWMHFTGHIRNRDFRATGVNIGAFVDGPELNGTPTMSALTGNAIYSGPASGLYTIEPGRNSQSRHRDREIGEYYSTIRLNVNFSNDNISGCIGCNGIFQISGVIEDDYSYDDSINARIQLGSVGIKDDGTFTGSDFTIQWGDVVSRSTSGFWGGKFSTTPDSDGEPRLVAGTNSISFVLSNDTEVNLVGTYTAKQ